MYTLAVILLEGRKMLVKLESAFGDISREEFIKCPRFFLYFRYFPVLLAVRE